MKKVEVIAALKEKGIEFAEGTKYNDLCKLLKGETTAPEAVEATKLRIANKIKKNNMFLADSVRNERDTAFLNAELNKRIHKGKIVRVTTVKEYEVIDGEWVTSFIIELKG